VERLVLPEGGGIACGFLSSWQCLGRAEGCGLCSCRSVRDASRSQPEKFLLPPVSPLLAPMGPLPAPVGPLPAPVSLLPAPVALFPAPVPAVFPSAGRPSAPALLR